MDTETIGKKIKLGSGIEVRVKKVCTTEECKKDFADYCNQHKDDEIKFRANEEKWTDNFQEWADGVRDAKDNPPNHIESTTLDEALDFSEEMLNAILKRCHMFNIFDYAGGWVEGLVSMYNECRVVDNYGVVRSIIVGIRYGFHTIKVMRLSKKYYKRL